MMLAVHHLDPVVGIDVHMVNPPPPAPPVPPIPLPHPHVGFVLDFREYLDAALAIIGSIVFTIVKDAVVDYLEENPDVAAAVAGAAGAVAGAVKGVAQTVASHPVGSALLSAAGKAMEISEAMGAGVGSGGFLPARPVLINGFFRASAGTHTYHVPGLHFPLGAGWGGVDMRIPSSDSESFMGSKTVLAAKDPLSYMALAALSCWFAGMVPMKHCGSHMNRTYLSLPTSVMLPIPLGNPVLVGGAPIFNMFAVLGGLFKAFRGSQAAKNLAKKLKLKDGTFLKCTVLKAEPVDTTTGEVVVQQNDFTVEGRLPLVWDRHYAGQDTYDGAIGTGWQTPADIRLELIHHDDETGVIARFPDYATSFGTLPQSQGWENRVYDARHGHALYLLSDRLVLRTRESLEYHYRLPDNWAQILEARTAEALLTAAPSLPLSCLADQNGNAWQFERDERHVLTRLVESSRGIPTGRVIQCEKKADDFLGKLDRLTLIDATGQTYPLVRYEQDKHGDLIAVFDAREQPYCFEYQAGHQMVRHTDRNGLSFYYSYQLHSDNLWRVDHAWGDGGLYDYRFEYDLEHLETRSTDSLGHTTILQFNDQNQPVTSIDPLGGVSSYQYDGQGRTQSETDPSGNTTIWEYDTYGNLLRTVLPDGSAVSTAFNEDHKPVSILDPEGGKWCQDWDTRGNLTRQATPSGAATQYEYTEQGDLLHVTDPAGQRTTLYYDPLGFLAGLSDPMGQYTQFEHDARGNLLYKELANGDTTHYRYDTKNRLIECVLPDAKRIQCAYDAEGNLTHYRDEAGRETHFTYYCQGSLQSRADPDGSRVEYHYDTEEQLIGVTNQHGKRWQLKRDAAGRLIEEIDYWGQSRRYDYDPAGYLTRSTDPLDQVLTITCDKLGRIIKKQASEQDAETYQYNKRGQLLEAKNQFSKIERKYNKDGQLTKEKQQQANVNASIDYAYNPAGQLIEQTQQFIHQQQKEISFKHTQQYTYNALGQPESVQIDDHEPIRFTFDQIGRLTRQQQGEHFAQHYQYNKAGQLIRQASSLKGQLQTRIDYDYDDAGNLIRRNDSRIGIDQYRYDLLGQITAHADPTGKVRQFVYDKTGDRFKTHQEDGEERTLQHDDGSFWRLDKAGQLIQKQDAQGENTFLEWNAYGRLWHLTRRGSEIREQASGNSQVFDTGFLIPIAEYIYDALGRRICKVKAANPQCNSPAETIWFVWDGDVMVGEVKQQQSEPQHHHCDPSPRHCERSEAIQPANPNTSTVQPEIKAQFYTYYLGSFVPLAMQTQTLEGQGVGKSLYFYQNDPNGIPLRLQDVNGIIKWEAHYSAFGLVDRLSVGVVEQPLRLQGQYFDGESGLQYNRHRYYDAGVGCFTSADPIGLEGGENPYRFAPNVLGWVDPLGLTCDFDVKANRYRDSVTGRFAKPPTMVHTSGTTRPPTTGATPNSIYTHIDPRTGKAVQNAVYDSNGNVIAHIDFKNHGGATSGHYHTFPVPGNPASGHGAGNPHHPHSTLPSSWGWDALPPGVSPHTPIGG